MKIFYHCCPTKERGWRRWRQVRRYQITPFETYSARYCSLHKCQRGLIRGQPSAEMKQRGQTPMFQNHYCTSCDVQR